MKIRFINGALLAAAVAGPIASAPLFLSAGYQSYGPAGIGAGVIAMVGAMMLTIPFGFVITVVPALSSAELLAFLGQRFGLARHPAAWAVSGFVVGTLAGSIVEQDFAATNTFFGSIGVVCALLARRRTHWID